MAQIRELVDQVSITLINFLESHEGISQIEFHVEEPTTQFEMWPELCETVKARSDVSLPDDLKAFFCCCNGLTLTYEMQNLLFGYLHINSLQDMKSVSRESLVELQRESADVTHAFEIDCKATNGRVALVYKSSVKNQLAEQEQNAPNDNLMMLRKHSFTTEIWFQDLAMQWFFVTQSFTQYFRLCLLHLGIPHWQYAFTSVGLPPQSRKWFAFLSPERLEIDKHGMKQALDKKNKICRDCDNSTTELPKQKAAKKKKLGGYKVNLNKVNQILKKQKHTTGNNENMNGGASTTRSSSSSVPSSKHTTTNRPQSVGPGVTRRPSFR